MEKLTKNELKFFSKLQQKKYREEHGLFLVQGKKLVSEAIKTVPEAVHTVISIENDWANQGYNFIAAGSKDMERLSSMKSAPEVIAVVRSNFSPDYNKSGWSILLDEIKDPGNLGTIIRLADWFGVGEIVCSKETVDIFNPKVVQATMGSVFRVNIEYTDLSLWLEGTNKPLFLATMLGVPMKDVDFPEEGILAMGSESHGFIHLDGCGAKKICIPSKGEAESLNVAMATGILLSHIVS